MDVKFRCINCGADSELLYEGLTPDTIELKVCNNCNKVLDHYLEYDTVIVILDLVLMTKEAYRHVLFNTSFERHWKMAILIILVQGFFDWSTFCNTSSETNPSNIIIFDEKIYGSFLLQMSFFCLLATFECVFFMCFILLLIGCYWSVWPKKRPDGFSAQSLWKGMVLSSFQQFFLVASIIWHMLHGEPHTTAIHTFHFFSATLAFSVVCYTSWATSAAIVASGAVCKSVLRHILVSSVLGLEAVGSADLCATLTT